MWALENLVLYNYRLPAECRLVGVFIYNIIYNLSDDSALRQPPAARQRSYDIIYISALTVGFSAAGSESVMDPDTTIHKVDQVCGQ